MRSHMPYLKPADAARRLGVSSKALRLYEARGLVAPGRTASGWRSYGPDDMARAAEIVALRALGLSLVEIGRVLAGDASDLAPALARHQQLLEARIKEMAEAVDMVRALRGALTEGKAPGSGELARLLGPVASASVAVDLPWPWGGERFELRSPCRITYIVGPLGSGKTRLARLLAETMAGGVYLDLDRLAEDGAVAAARLRNDLALHGRVAAALDWLEEDGATRSPALTALLVGLLGSNASSVVVDMVEQGLDHASQEAVIAYLRRGGTELPRLFLMTRSSAILDLAAVGPDEAIIFCPANHSPPSLVAPYPGAPGYEALASCLATPAVRARTDGVVALRPAQA